MKKYLMLIFFTITLLFLVGCEKKEGGTTGTITPIVTVTAELSPTDIPASIDSGDEKFVDLTDEQVDEIIKLSEQYEMNGWDYTIISRELMAYYLYTENVNIELPVIISSTPEKAKELFGENWISVNPIMDEKTHKYQWTYGVLTVKEIEKSMEEKVFDYVYIVEDHSVGVSSSQFRDLRYGGDVYIFRDDNGIYKFDYSMYSDLDKIGLMETTPIATTPSPEPINTIVPTPTDVPATVDSGDEIFIELTEQQTEDIRSIAIGFSGDPYGASLTHWMTAYYTYFEKGDVEIPVVIKATPEEVKEVYSGQWIPVYEAYSEDNIIHAYGVLSASEIKEVIEEDIFSSIKISADDSVKVQGESYFLTLSYPHVNISSYRHNGDVYIWQEDGIYYFFGTPYPG